MLNAEDRLVNLLGAVATGIADATQEAMLCAPHLEGSAPSALIALLDFSPAGSVQALSQIVGLTHSGAVRLVDRLTDAGYVTRRPGPDGRTLTVQLTTAGAALARRVRSARAQAITQFVATLSADERAVLERLCANLVGEITTTRLEARSAGQPAAAGALCRLCDFAACGRPEGACPAAQTATGR